MKLDLISYTKINSEWIKDQVFKNPNYKILKQNRGVNLHGRGLGNGFLAMTTKA